MAENTTGVEDNKELKLCETLMYLAKENREAAELFERDVFRRICKAVGVELVK